MEWKLELARRITARWHGADGARAGEEHFTRVVRQGKAPVDAPVVGLRTESIHLPKLLAEELGNSRSYWRRLIAQGAVRLDGQIVSELDIDAGDLIGKTLQVGRQALRFVAIGT
jgi:tyrosyl-tRNA synthetase